MFNEKVLEANIKVIKIKDLRLGDKILYGNNCAKIIEINENNLMIQPFPSYEDLIIEIRIFPNFYKIIDCKMTEKYSYEHLNRECSANEAFKPITDYFKNINVDIFQYLTELTFFTMEKHNLSHSKALEYLYQDLITWLRFDPIVDNIIEEFGENFIKIFDNENEI